MQFFFLQYITFFFFIIFSSLWWMWLLHIVCMYIMNKAQWDEVRATNPEKMPTHRGCLLADSQWNNIITQYRQKVFHCSQIFASQIFVVHDYTLSTLPLLKAASSATLLRWIHILVLQKWQNLGSVECVFILSEKILCGTKFNTFHEALIWKN